MNKESVSPVIQTAKNHVLSFTRGDVFRSETEAQHWAVKLGYAAYRNPAIAKCSVMSIVRSIMFCHSAQADPSSQPADAHLVPFGNELQTIFGYEFLLRKLYEAGIVKKVEIQIVFKEDEFSHRIVNNETFIDFTPNYTIDRERYDEFIVAFLIAELENGKHFSLVMTRENIMKSEAAASRGGKKSPAWSQWQDRMIKKVLIKTACKYIPCPKNLRQVLQQDSAQEVGRLKVDLKTGELEIGEEEKPKASTEDKEKLKKELKQVKSKVVKNVNDAKKVVKKLEDAKPEDMDDENVELVLDDKKEINHPGRL